MSRLLSTDGFEQPCCRKLTHELFSILRRLSLFPVWLPFDAGAARLKGRRIRIIDSEGAKCDTLVKIGISESDDGAKKCNVILTESGTDDPRKWYYLTEEALQMVKEAPESEQG